jgi:hypothetical protein
MKKQKLVLLVFGLILLIIAACLMIDGNILGERTVPAGVVATITGIGAITSARKPERQCR